MYVLKVAQYLLTEHVIYKRADIKYTKYLYNIFVQQQVNHVKVPQARFMLILDLEDV